MNYGNERKTHKKKSGFGKALRHRKIAFFLCSLLLCILFLNSLIRLNEHSGSKRIIAHRGGGTMAGENSIAGLEAAIRQGCCGSEIDIQRTKDGHYILCHDEDLSRLCGLSVSPTELTLEELKALQVTDTSLSGDFDTGFASLEEALTTAKDLICLYIELKGSSADWQMAEDVYLLAEDYQMLDQIVVISMDYALISDLKDRHPQIRTGYLTASAIEVPQDYNCDELLLESFAAEQDTIRLAHEAEKEVYVWTVNSHFSMLHHLMGEADGIITDRPRMVGRIIRIFD